MVVLKTASEKKSILIRGRLGNPAGLGLIRTGWSKCGDTFLFAGIFRKNGRWHKQETVKMRHYRPSNPQTARQQFFRDYFRNSVAIFHALSPEIIELFRKRAVKYHLSAYNYYISEYSRIKPSHVGNYRMGYTKLGVLTYLY